VSELQAIREAYWKARFTGADEGVVGALFDALHTLKARQQSRRVPLSEVFAHKRFGAEVRRRVARLNPYGPLEGEVLRGWHPHHSFTRRWDMDVIGPKAFIARFGREAYRSLPNRAFVRNGHRKAISREYVEDCVPPPTDTGAP
jgi:hypothetical protein